MPSISVALDNGEVCKRPMGAFVSNTAQGTSTTVATPIDMAADWDSVYGPGYFAAHVLGNNYR